MCENLLCMPASVLKQTVNKVYIALTPLLDLLKSTPHVASTPVCISEERFHAVVLARM